jgi:hypothetical protein
MREETMGEETSFACFFKACFFKACSFSHLFFLEKKSSAFLYKGIFSFKAFSFSKRKAELFFTKSSPLGISQREKQSFSRKENDPPKGGFLKKTEA